MSEHTDRVLGVPTFGRPDLRVHATRFKRILMYGRYEGHNRWRHVAFRHLVDFVEYFDERQLFDPTVQRRMGDRLRYRLGRGPLRAIHHALLTKVRQVRPDLVWIDKGLFVDARTVEGIRDSGALIVHCNHDDFLYPSYAKTPYRAAIPEYDLHLVPRSVNLHELLAEGARAVAQFAFSYEPSIHRPTAASSRPHAAVFVGHCEPGRAEVLEAIAGRGVQVELWGDGWPRSLRRGKLPLLHYAGSGVFGSDYAATFTHRLGVGLLSKWSRDEHTCRSLEIPASGGALAAVRTRDHELIFGPYDLEMAESEEELPQLVDRLYSDRTALRRQIERGSTAVREAGFDHLTEARRHLLRLELL